jgi:hypothetical protein
LLRVERREKPRAPGPQDQDVRIVTVDIGFQSHGSDRFQEKDTGDHESTGQRAGRKRLLRTGPRQKLKC